MFVKHLEQYTQKSNQKVWQILHALRDAELIETHKFYNQTIIRLKQYPLLKLKNIDRTSIKLSKPKIMRTAFLNSIVLSKINDKRNVQDILNYILDRTNLVISSDEYLYKVITKLVEQKKDTSRINLELTNLKQKGKFTIENLRMREIYLDGFGFKNDKLLVKADLIDLNNSFQVDNLFEKLRDTYQHIIDLFCPEQFKSNQIQLNVFVADADRKKALERKKRFIEQRLMHNQIFNSFAWQVIDTNITNTLFGGNKILVGSYRK